MALPATLNRRTRLPAALAALAVTAAAAGVATVLDVPAAHAAVAVPAHVFAPYFEAYSSDDPATVSQNSGAKYLSMAFIQTASSGSCTVYWNGNTAQPIGSTFASSISTIRSRGGDVIPSFGGYTADTTNTEIADSCTSVSSIASALENVITSYDLSRVDFDVEQNSLTNSAGIDRRNKAIAQVESWAAGNGRNVRFSYTLPTNTDGLDSGGKSVLSNAVANGARIDVVNIMTFDYYTGATIEMANATESAAQGLESYLASLYPGKSAAQLWGMVGVTEMPGIDDYGAPETFTQADAKTVLNWADSKGINEISMWASERDNGGCPGTAGSDTCSGISQPTWYFSDTWDPFTSGTAPANDFSITASPSSGAVNQGSSTSATVSTTVTSGAAQSVALSASGLPSGATASFSPSPVTSGGSSTLTIATSSSTPAGTYTVTITGAAASGSHTTTYSLTVSGSGGSTEAIVNGGFETGNFTGWTRAGANQAIVTSPVHAGKYAAMLGNTVPTNGDSTISQTFTAPAGSSSVSFQYDQNCPDDVQYDWANATLHDNTANTTVTMLPNTCTLGAGWKQVSSAVVPGHSYTIKLLSHDENNPGDPTDTVFDDVTCAGSGTSANDFSIAASAASGSVTAGSPATATVSTAVTSGSAQSVALSASGLPSGASASFSPSPVTAGGSSTLTIATSSNTPAGTYPVTVTGTAASGSHAATYTLTVTAPSTGCTAAQLLGDPGFENGTSTAPWTQSSTLGFNPITQATSAEPAHSGSWVAWFNGNGSKDTDTIAQSVTIASGCKATLSYWLHVDSTENTTTATPDTYTVQVLNGSGTVLATVGSFSNLNAAPGYVQHSADLSAYAGQTVTVKFIGSETDTSGGTTDFVLDDTALNTD